MNRPALFLASAVIALGGIGLFLVLRSRPEPAGAPAAVVAGTPAPAASPAAPPASAPTGDASRPARPRAAEPAPAAPAAPVAEAPAPPLVSLHIDSDVPGAQVFIDRQFVGAAPITTAEIAPGSHQLNLSAPGFEGIARSIDVAPGSNDVMVRFKVVQLNVRTDVVHKHRIGSCRGTLVATPDGLRYETTNKDDAFTAPLTGVDELQVEYLEKNLRVRTKAGKQYNFTDPDGNADRLLVFQRDVNKARARLLAGDRPAGN